MFCNFFILQVTTVSSTFDFSNFEHNLSLLFLVWMPRCCWREVAKQSVMCVRARRFPPSSTESARFHPLNLYISSKSAP